MAKLIYAVIVSLDGYVDDGEGNFDWAAPDEAVHAFVNDLERSVGIYLYGRRMYETMVYWETEEREPTDRRTSRTSPRSAGGRQGRVLDDAGGGLQRQDADRTRLRPGCDQTDEGDGGA